MADDLETRVTLLERTAMSRESVIEREERLLERIDALMSRHSKQAEQTLEHTLKVFGHDMAEQLQKMRIRIHEERDEKLRAEVSAIKTEMDKPPPPPPATHTAPIRAFMATHWMWIAAIILLVAVLRPDLAGSVLCLL